MKRRNFIKLVAGLFITLPINTGATVKPQPDKREQLRRWFNYDLAKRGGVSIVQTRIHAKALCPEHFAKVQNFGGVDLQGDYASRPPEHINCRSRVIRIGDGDVFINKADGSRERIGTAKNMRLGILANGKE